MTTCSVGDKAMNHKLKLTADRKFFLLKYFKVKTNVTLSLFQNIKHLKTKK